MRTRFSVVALLVLLAFIGVRYYIADQSCEAWLGFDATPMAVFPSEWLPGDTVVCAR